MIYVFDIHGKLINEFSSTPLALKEYKIKKNTLYQAIKRKSIHDAQYYFSFENYFTVPNKKSNHNPLKSLSSSRPSAFTSDLAKEVDSYFRSSESDLYFC